MSKKFKEDLIILTLVSLGSLAAITLIPGCSGVDRANDWLASPATTQPNSPTHEQVITTIGTATAPVLGGWGGVAQSGLLAGLILLHNLDSRKRTQGLDQAVDDLKTTISNLPPSKK